MVSEKLLLNMLEFKGIVNDVVGLLPRPLFVNIKKTKFMITDLVLGLFINA
jgi:hypothetical protein